MSLFLLGVPRPVGSERTLRRSDGANDRRASTRLFPYRSRLAQDPLLLLVFFASSLRRAAFNSNEYVSAELPGMVEVDRPQTILIRVCFPIHLLLFLLYFTIFNFRYNRTIIAHHTDRRMHQAMAGLP